MNDFFSFCKFSAIRVISTIALSMILVACGGGGGGGGGGTTPPPSSSAPAISSQATSSSLEASSTSSESSQSSSSSTSVSSQSSEASESSSIQPSSSSSSLESSSDSSSSSTSSVSSAISVSSISSQLSSSSSVSSRSSTSSSSSSVSSSSSTSSSSSLATTPSVDAGPQQTVISGSQVNFSATAQAGAGQSIASYLWEQIDETNISVTLINESQLNASFTAPYVSSPAQLIFRLTVTDDQDQTATDTVTITVNQDPNAPAIHVTFPPPESIYNPTDNSNQLAIFGQATPQGAATVDRITIKGASANVEATRNGQQWRANNLAIPEGISEIVLTVEAEDSLGRISQQSLALTVSDSYGPESGSEARAILWDDVTNKLWILSSGFWTSDTQIIPVNPRTGVRESSILTTPLAARRMIFNADKSGFIVSGAISNQAGKIHLVNKSNGTVSVLSGTEKGEGPDLQTGSAGLALAGDVLYVAENVLNGFSGLMSVDLSSGDRQILQESEDTDSLTYALADIAYHNNEVLMVKNSFSNSRVYGYNVDTEASRQIHAGNSSIGGTARLLVSGTDVFGISQNQTLSRINIATGAMSNVSNKLRQTGGSGYKHFTYDSNNRLFYYVTRSQTVSVVDEVSGHVVDLAGQ